MTNHADQELRLRLKGLRQDIVPGVDLWPGIADRLHERPPRQTRTLRSRFRWVPLAAAASVALAIGLTWTRGSLDRPAPVIHGEAVAMAAHYQAALDEYAQTPMQPELQPAIDLLDRNAVSIMAAIKRHPEARFLLDQLRRTYHRRLELTQRAIITS